MRAKWPIGGAAPHVHDQRHRPWADRTCESYVERLDALWTFCARAAYGPPAAGEAEESVLSGGDGPLHVVQVHDGHRGPLLPRGSPAKRYGRPRGPDAGAVLGDLVGRGGGAFGLAAEAVARRGVGAGHRRPSVAVGLPGNGPQVGFGRLPHVLAMYGRLCQREICISAHAFRYRDLPRNNDTVCNQLQQAVLWWNLAFSP